MEQRAKNLKKIQFDFLFFECDIFFCSYYTGKSIIDYFFLLFAFMFFMIMSNGTFQPPPKKQIQLIVFGSNGNIDYFNGCKIIIDAIKRIFIVTPNKENSKSIVTSFDEKFLHQKNILFVVSSSTEKSDFAEFAIIFQSEKTCANVYENIQKRKDPKILHKNVGESDALLFQTKFFTRMITDIDNNNKFKTHLEEIIIEFLISLSTEERKPYLSILNNLKLFASKSSADLELKNGLETNLFLTTLNNSENKNSNPKSMDNTVPLSSRKRTLSKLKYSIDSEFKESGSNGNDKESPENCPPFKKQQIMECEPVIFLSQKFMDKEQTVIKKSNFKIFDKIVGGKLRSYLRIFNSKDKNLYREYLWSEKLKQFNCGPCQNKYKKRVFAKLIKNESDEYVVELCLEKHECNEKEAKTNKDEVVLSILKNASKLIEIDEKNIISSDGFKIDSFMDQNNKETTRLIIYDENDKTLGYIYFYSKCKKAFVCDSCKIMKEFVTAKQIKNKIGENIIQLGVNKHICQKHDLGNLTFINPKISEKEKIIEQQPQILDKNFHPNKITTTPSNKINPSSGSSKIIFKEKRIILHKPDFKIDYFICNENNVQKRRRIIVFDSKNIEFCYIYFFVSSTKLFACQGCLNLKKSTTTTAKLDLDENGDDYLELDGNEHICKSIKYASLLEKTFMKPSQWKFEYYKVDGIKKQFLTVYDPNNENSCYVYYETLPKIIFTCKNCKELGHQVTAMVIQGKNGESNLQFSEFGHVCQPEPVETKMDDPSKFQLQMNSKNEVTKICIFIIENKSMFYEFLPYRENCFRCKECFENNNKISEVKVFEDEIGNFYIKHRNFEHSCQPFKIFKPTKI